MSPYGDWGNESWAEMLHFGCYRGGLTVVKYFYLSKFKKYLYFISVFLWKTFTSLHSKA